TFDLEKHMKKSPAALVGGEFGRSDGCRFLSTKITVLHKKHTFLCTTGCKVHKKGNFIIFVEQN
ncbi:MAG: hypothetical protein K2H65_05890, partial [Bacteroidales bacterium]|nr:hypothetical protein [Bacteroidales bacterium]